MLSPRTPCETGVSFCGTKHPESAKGKFPRYTYLVHLLGFGEWHLSPLWAPPCKDSHIDAISSPHLKLQKKCRGQHSMTTVPYSTVRTATITRPNLRQVGRIFKLGQLLRPPGKERYCDGPCCLAGGGLRSTGGFEATVPTEKPLLFTTSRSTRMNRKGAFI